MIIIQLTGGLGNQLQQYALYRKFVRLGKEARLDISWFTDLDQQNKVTAHRDLELDYFDRLIYEISTTEEKERLIGRDDLIGKIRRTIFPHTIRRFSEEKMYHPEVLEFDDMYISGYFACERYYADILYELRERIQFPPSPSPLNQSTAAMMNNRTSVSVHFRRGDYLDKENAGLFGNICTDSYYAMAMEYVRKRCPDAHFFLFSDDPVYIRERYTDAARYTIVDWNHGRDSFYDMWLMSQCRHNICANSTFSFWGARLNDYADKIMIRPALHKNTQMFEAATMRELWPGWVLVNKDGEVFE